MYSKHHHRQSQDAKAYQMREGSRYEKANVVDFRKISEELQYVYRKKNQNKFDYSQYFDLNNFGMHDKYNLAGLVQCLRKEEAKQLKERR